MSRLASVHRRIHKYFFQNRIPQNQLFQITFTSINIRSRSRTRREKIINNDLVLVSFYREKISLVRAASFFQWWEWFNLKVVWFPCGFGISNQRMMEPDWRILCPRRGNGGTTLPFLDRAAGRPSNACGDLERAVGCRGSKEWEVSIDHSHDRLWISFNIL